MADTETENWSSSNWPAATAVAAHAMLLPCCLQQFLAKHYHSTQRSTCCSRTVLSLLLLLVAVAAVSFHAAQLAEIIRHRLLYRLCTILQLVGSQSCHKCCSNNCSIIWPRQLSKQLQQQQQQQPVAATIAASLVASCKWQAGRQTVCQAAYTINVEQFHHNGARLPAATRCQLPVASCCCQLLLPVVVALVAVAAYVALNS